MQLVAEYLSICRLDPVVDAVRAPAEPAAFVSAGARIGHVADFEVVRDGATVLVDVVSEWEFAHHPLRDLVSEATCSSVDGRPFLLETAATIRAEPRFSTVKLVLACRRTQVSAGDRVRILHHLDECGTAPLVECAGAAQNSVDGVAAVLALAVEGLVAVDIDGPILPETSVRRRKFAVSGA